LPPLVAPFRGERYASRDRLSPLVAPPYDVISKEERARYAARDPHNIVHLILPEAPAGADRYAHAATQLGAWRDAGVVRVDAAESVYVVAQDYALPSGEQRSRIGMFAAVRAEPFSTRRVRPHEQTHSAPGADRVLAFVVSAGDPGLTILPTHRIIFGSGRDAPKLLEGWRRWFDVGRVAPCMDRVERLAELGRQGTACIVAFPDAYDVSLV